MLSNTKRLLVAGLATLSAGTALGAAVGVSPAAAATPCGWSYTGSMSGPAGSRWEFITVRNCTGSTIHRRVTVSNWKDDVCETYLPGQIKYLTVWTAPQFSHANGLAAC